MFKYNISKNIISRWEGITAERWLANDMMNVLSRSRAIGYIILSLGAKL